MINKEKTIYSSIMSNNIWSIRNKFYDLSDFIDNHPGGSKILEVVRNSGDCTPLFESYHSMADIEQIKSIMAKYEIKSDKLNEYNLDICNNPPILLVIYLAYHIVTD
jgi:cytochrome b involved in lipid metabolism